MVDATIRMTVPIEKLNEVLQTFKAILDPIRREQGCISCNCYLDVETDNTLLFLEEWQTGKDLRSHLQSAHFGILMGAMNLLDQEPHFKFNTIISSAGREVVKTAGRGARRGGQDN